MAYFTLTWSLHKHHLHSYATQYLGPVGFKDQLLSLPSTGYLTAVWSRLRFVDQSWEIYSIP